MKNILCLNQLKLSQMSILKTQIKMFEKYSCKVSREEWVDYYMLFIQ